MGVNERSKIKMTPEEADAYIHAGKTIVMCTINHDGTIHAVAMYYGFLDGCVAFETKTKSQKVQNLRRDPRITCLVETGETYEQLRGVELVGRGEIVDDPGRMWEAGVSVFERYNAPYTEEMKPFVEIMLRKRVGIAVHVDRVVSWDHAKLNMGGT